MHEPVKGRLEDYLQGGGPFPDVEAHLAACEECRTEVSAMRTQALLLRGLRAPREIDPSVGFYARVMNRIEAQPRPSAWFLFGESVFARRLAFASFASLLLFGAFLVPETDRTGTVASNTPETILAGDRADVPPPIEVHPRERGAVLVNLASFQQDYQ